MNLSISNIAWCEDYDEEIYTFIKDQGFKGVEIAPTRIISSNPYDKLKLATTFKNNIKENLGLQVVSMQSIWYGKNEKIFGTSIERQTLLDYTKKAIDFAHTIECGNLVFGCPKNRIIAENDNVTIALDFLREIGEYAHRNNTVVSVEPNPPIYGTNFINTTKQAIEIVRQINSKGIAVNLDFGTIIQNNETLDVIENNLDIINHIHISEPYLELIQKREQHKKLADILRRNNYEKFVSIEMKNLENINLVKETMGYVKEVFG